MRGGLGDMWSIHIESFGDGPNSSIVFIDPLCIWTYPSWLSLGASFTGDSLWLTSGG
jgi:hypothetical protein